MGTSIVIMKCIHNIDSFNHIEAFGVWHGSLANAEAWCDSKSIDSVSYYPVQVKHIKGY